MCRDGGPTRIPHAAARLGPWPPEPHERLGQNPGIICLGAAEESWSGFNKSERYRPTYTGTEGDSSHPALSSLLLVKLVHCLVEVRQLWGARVLPSSVNIACEEKGLGRVCASGWQETDAVMERCSRGSRQVPPALGGSPMSPWIVYMYISGTPNS